MLKDCKSLSLWTDMCKYTTNAGLGPTLENIGPGWYATDQFALDVIFNNRMKQYSCLTNDSSRAAAVFVPFYAGLDAARHLWGPANASARDAASVDLVNWLERTPEWSVMGGKDHFLVAGRIAWDFGRWTDKDSDWGNKLLLLPAVKNMSVLVVESSPWTANDFAVPYPTYFHPARDDDVSAWQDRMRRSKRKRLFCFAGAPRPGNSRSIRGLIIEQCGRSKQCRLLGCGSGGCYSPSLVTRMFEGCKFCLQPQGDSLTRRSAFDSMVAGCVPVYFHPGSAYVQYTWHLPRNYSAYSVFVPEDDVRGNVTSIERRLSRISNEKVKEMREMVIRLIPRLIYADPRSKMEKTEDAFDVAVGAVIDKVAKVRKEMNEGIYREIDSFREKLSWKYGLLDEGQEIGPHEWDRFFQKP
ncbi:xyloglucan galactosyltransferase katamari1 [Phtheirospermum japonicum]|uniref:Xyloglucan galactosyltransferase katamari1 n=1 Tax=Phtheirospermum japonicum TaxID=374723 RepID=A0A830BDV4_9LAMI|nr:xyloglucan galactosyltransferase katamari1 [Phtheirospermum japonicum]